MTAPTPDPSTAPRTALRALRSDGPSGFGRPFGLSLGVHAAVLGCAFLVAYGAHPGVRAAESQHEARLVLAQSQPAPEWEREDPTPPEEPLELPREEPTEMVPLEDPLEAQPFDPEPALDPLPEDPTLHRRLGGRPLTRLEYVPPAAPVEPAPAAAAAVEEAPSAPRGEDRALALVESPSPSYPRLSQRLQEEGSVTLRIEVDASGRVLDVTLVESSRFARLDKAALEAVRGWSFRPALEDGRPVASSLVHKVSFRLNAAR